MTSAKEEGGGAPRLRKIGRLAASGGQDTPTPRRLPPYNDEHTCPDCGGYVPRGECLACGRWVRPSVRAKFADGSIRYASLRDVARGGR